MKQEPSQYMIHSGAETAATVTAPMLLNIENIQKATVAAWNAVYPAPAVSTSLALIRMYGKNYANAVKPRHISIYFCAALLRNTPAGTDRDIALAHGGKPPSAVNLAGKYIRAKISEGDTNTINIIADVGKRLQLRPSKIAELVSGEADLSEYPGPPQPPSVDQIARAVISLFHHQYGADRNTLSLTKEKMLTSNGVYAQVRPYSIYREVCALACRSLTGMEDDKLDAYFSLPRASVGADRAQRGIQLQNPPAYSDVYNRLREHFYPDLPEIAPKFVHEKKNIPVISIAPQPHEEETYEEPTNELQDAPPPVKDIDTSDTRDQAVDCEVAEGDKKLGVEEIQGFCVQAWNRCNPAIRSQVSTPEICGDNRNRTLVHARQISMYISRLLISSPKNSYPEIGRKHGGRDHTTVLYAARKIQKSVNAENEMTLSVIKTFAQVSGISPRQLHILLNPPEARITPKAKPPSGIESHLRP